MKTINYLLLTVLTSVLGAHAYAQQVVSLGGKQCNDEKVYERCIKKYPNQEAYCAAFAAGCGTTSMSEPGKECSEAKKELQKKESDFEKICGKSGVKGMTCVKAGDLCDKCNGADESDASCAAEMGSLLSSSKRDRLEERQERREELEDLNYANSSAYDELDIEDVPSFQLAACAPFAKETAQTKKEELDELRKDLKDAKEKSAELETDLMTKRNAIADAMTEYSEAKTKAENAFKEALKQGNRDAQQANEKAMEEKTKISNAIDELHAKMRRREVDYHTQVASIEKICEDQAEKETLDERAKRTQRTQSGTQRSRSLSALLKTATQGRVAQDEAFRRRAIARCKLNDTKYKKPLEILNNNFAADLKEMEEAILRLLAARKTIDEQMSSRNSQYNQDFNDATEKFQKDMIAMEQAHYTKIGQCPGAAGTKNGTQTINTVAELALVAYNKKKGTQPKASTQNCTGLQGELVMAEKALQTNEKEINNLEKKISNRHDIYSEAIAYASGKPTKDFSAGDFSAAYGEYKVALAAKDDVCPPSAPAKTQTASPTSSPSTTQKAQGVK